jgi:Sigma-70, region 4
MATQQPAQPHDAGLESQREEVREASTRLPNRQREALALCDLEQLSYEEIAAIMGVRPGSVAQLISRARINLYDELRGTVLASIAAPSPDCERALLLIAAREDGHLEAISGDADWLDAHLAGCDRCRLGVEQMREADASYRAWASTAAPVESLPGTPSADLRAASRRRLPRGRAALAGALAALLLLGGLAAVLVGDDGTPAPASPAAGTASGEPEPGAKSAAAGREKGGAAKEKARSSKPAEDSSGTIAADAGPSPVAAPAHAPSGGDSPSEPASGPIRPSGKTGVEPTRQTSAPKPSPKPKPAATATPAPQPAPAPEAAAAPAAEAPSPAEEPSDEPGRRAEAPGKPSSHPPH